MRDWLVPGSSAAGRLSSRAGHANFEALEARQLLFTITIGPGDVNPVTGLGQVSAVFGYVIPYLLPTTEVQDQDPTEVLEDFEDELPMGATTQNVINGRIFNDSNLQIRHNITPPADVQLVTRDSVELRIRGQVGEQFNFRINNGSFLQAMRTFQFEVGDQPVGMPISNMRITIFYAGEVVQVWEGAQQIGALNLQNPGQGYGLFVIQATPTAPGLAPPSFDEVRFEFIAGTTNPGFFIDNIQITSPAGNFAQLIDQRVFGAIITLAGPVGASVQVLDLYGRDMRRTTALKTPPNLTVPRVDPNDDGVPDFNDGIGQIILRGTDSRTSVTLFGGTIDDMDVFEVVDNFVGLFEDFESAGFGYDLTQDPMPNVIGLPPGPGSVIVGSPFVRNNQNPATYLPAANAMNLGLNFLRADQGIFARDGGNVGTVFVHGVMHGTSQFNGAVDQISIGYLVGSISVAGDLGALVVGTDAGLWVPDEPGQRIPTVRQVKTGGELIVGRTVGEVAIAGRSMLDVTVLGDLNSPQTRPARDVFRYYERESAYNSPTGLPEVTVINATIARTIGHGLDIFQSAAGLPYFRSGQAVSFGEQLFRNDTLASAEWVGSIATAVQIHGEVGLADAVNTREDPSDVFAFAVDGSNPVLLELSMFPPAPTAGFLRILDVNGRTIAAASRNDELVVLTPTGLSLQTRVEFMPPAPGVYYAVVTGQSSDGGTAVTNAAYVLTIGGMAPTVFGSLRVGGGFGGDAQEFIPNQSATITVLSGAMGAVRIGTGFVDGGGAEVDPTLVINSDEDLLDDVMGVRGGTISVPGTLYEMWVGADVRGVGPRITNVNIGGDLGRLIVGMSEVVGVAPEQGDLSAFSLTVGGRIGAIDVRGAIGINQDADPDSIDGPDTINIRSGAAGGNGSIGIIRVGAHIGSGTLNVTTSPGSTIGAFLVSQDIAFDPNDQNIGIYTLGGPADGVTFTMGAGSDLRFVDFPRIDLTAAENSLIPIIAGQPVNLTDDAGGRVRIEVIGAPFGLVVGTIRVIAVDGSQGVAIGRITVDLVGGRRLLVTSLSQPGFTDRVSIGRIIVVDSDDQSSIGIEGNSQIDVWQIEDTGGGGLLEITNLTPNGDIVAIDVATLSRLEIRSGNLGDTELPSYGPSQIGPFIGIGQGAGDRAIVIIGPMDNDWNGQMFRPANDPAATRGDGNAYLDDIGSPVSPYLNGLIVRDGGTIASLRVGGSVRNVIVQNGFIFDMVVNSDNQTPLGQFHGIVGSIYAGEVITLNVGDGIARRTQSPFDTPGIFAADDIRRVFAQRPGAFISGAIVAGNINPLDDPELGVFGIGTIEILNTGGDYVDAYIGAFNLDRYWNSYFYERDDRQAVGHATLIRGQNADMFRTEIQVFNLQTLDLQGGFYDASQIAAEGIVTTIQAVGFRNSTRTGGNREFRPSEIRVGLDLVTLTTFGQNGDISDTLIDVIGSVTNRIAARSITRSQIEVNNTINLLSARVDIAGSRINTGQLTSGVVTRNLVASEVFVSGPLVSLTADSMRNTRVEVTGPNGRLDLLRTRGLLGGEIASTGPVTRIQSTAGDIVARITTTTDRGNVARVEAFRDLDIQTDISGTVTELIAGRHVGNRATPGVILVRGNLQSLDVSNGQLYSDLRIGQALTGSVRIGQVSNKPGANLLGSGSILAFRRIANVEVRGDFDGSIVSYFGGIGVVTITDGSFLPGNTITALDGTIDRIEIVRGHLLGDIHADHTIHVIRVVASDNGIFGDIGVNPALSSNISAGPFRNELPPGVGASVAINGPRITAGHMIGLITTTNGSMFETTIHAGRFINRIEINGDVRNDGVTTGVGSAIVAGDTVNEVVIAGNAADLVIGGGILNLGANGRIGGVGVNADLVKTGRVVTVFIGGNANNVAVVAGMTAGADGLYGTADDFHALGFSWIKEVFVGGTPTNVRAFADSGQTTVSPGIAIGGRNSPVVDGLLAPILVDRDASGVPIFSQLGEVLVPGQAFNFTHGSESGTILFTGPGVAIWNEGQGRLILANTTLASSLTVTSNTGTLTNFRIISNDDASLGLLDVQANLLGASRIVIDAYVHTARITGMSSADASFIIGNDIQSLAMGSFTAGLISAIFVRNVGISGNVGGTLQIFGTEGINIVGGLSGLISVDRDIRGPFVVTGQMIGGRLRAGGNITSVSVGEVLQARISAGDNIGPINVAGNMVEGTILSGVDLGRDGTFGGVGLDADRVTTGSMGQVTIGGNMTRSSIAAGVTRGADGFFGTSSDSAAEGRSNIAGVRVNGQASGSNRNSENYRIIATGTIGTVTFGGQPGGRIGNFDVIALATQPLPIQVLDLQVLEDSRVYTARIYFNQPMDSSSLTSALSVSEVRGDAGQTRIRLVEGLDYFLSYDDVEHAAVVTFARSVTERPLPQQAGVPGPGIYRFELEQANLRAQLVNARLDGNGNGFVEPGDNYSQDDIVGDAGDKTAGASGRITLVNPQSGETNVVSAYPAINLNIVLDNNVTPDGLPDVNREFILRGSLGDHPNHDPLTFRFSGDVDVYRITLQAGQILRLGKITGGANQAARVLFDPSGNTVGGPTSSALTLPAEFDAEDVTATQAQNYLIKTTGDYFLVVAANTDNAGLFNNGATVPNTGPTAGGVGRYAFSIEVFDDDDTGFSATTSAGNGTNLVNAPTAISFAGPNGFFGGGDDLTQIVQGEFTFFLDPGPDGIKGTIDDVVFGTNGKGITSRRFFDPALGVTVVQSTIESAIGHPGAIGVPGTIFPDVDVYHLNNRLPVQPNTKIRINFRLAEVGGDLGARINPLFPDLSGQVQLAVFETTNSTGISDANLIFSPTDFLPAGGPNNVTLADDGSTKYGYDDVGDFYIEFVVPPSLLSSPNNPTAGTFAVYVQGVFHTDYVLEVSQIGTGTRTAAVQNIFIETRGGTIDWLEVNRETQINPFSTRPLGFTGTINGQPVDQFVLQTVVNNLIATFNAAGVTVNISTNPATFEFQDFSTVFLSTSNDPLNFFNDFIFGYSQGSDPFNANRNDEAVVFVPTFATLGYTPSNNDAVNLATSITAAMARRIGELVGLRISSNAGPGGTIDPMAANSVFNLPLGQTGAYRFSGTARALSTTVDTLFDTDFYLGNQLGLQLLNQNVQ